MPPQPTPQKTDGGKILELLLTLLELAPAIPALIAAFRQNAELTPEAAADLDRRIAEWGTKPSQKVEPKTPTT